MEEPKPCPFCGGRVEVVSDYNYGYVVRCNHCKLTFGAHGRLGEPYEWIAVFDSKEEAIEIWNLRRERVCKVVKEFVDLDGTYMTSYSCGCCNSEGRNHNYCPNCGARVIKETL